MVWPSSRQGAGSLGVYLHSKEGQGGAAQQLAEALDERQDLRLTRRAGPPGVLVLPESLP
jgi:hypothetical protein